MAVFDCRHDQCSLIPDLYRITCLQAEAIYSEGAFQTGKIKQMSRKLLYLYLFACFDFEYEYIRFLVDLDHTVKFLTGSYQ